MSKPRLSICMPVYNGQRYLAAGVESILAQTFVDLELVIVDNASTDATEDICRDFARRDQRVRYHRNVRNLGAAPNFNRAFELSRAPLIRWASHDDLWAGDAMWPCVDAMDRDPTIVCCHGRTAVIDESGRPMPDDPATRARLYDPDDRRLGDDRPSVRLRDLLLRTHWCYEIFGVIRRSALRDTSLHGSFYGSDKVLLAELAMVGRIVTLDPNGPPMFFRRDHSGNSTSLRTHAERAQWMDTSLGGKLARPHLKLLKGYFGAIRRSAHPAGEKLACYRALLGWMAQVKKLKTVVKESDRGDAPSSSPAGNRAACIL